MTISFERVGGEVESIFDDETRKKLHYVLKQIGYEMGMKMEHILEEVVKDNPYIPVEDMVLRYNLNHIPVDIITKDGKVLYDFKKEL